MRPTVDQVFNAAEAGHHLGFLVGPGGMLDFKLGEEVSLLRLHLQLGRLEGLRLFGKLSDQAVPLFGQLAAFRLLAPEGGVGFAQLLLQGGVGLCKKGKKTRTSINQQRRDTVAEEIWPDCSVDSLNLGDYSPRVRQRTPA